MKLPPPPEPELRTLVHESSVRSLVVHSYTPKQLRTAQREAALMALDAAIDKVALHGGSVEIEAAIRALRTELEAS